MMTPDCFCPRLYLLENLAVLDDALDLFDHEGAHTH